MLFISCYFYTIIFFIGLWKGKQEHYINNFGLTAIFFKAFIKISTNIHRFFRVCTYVEFISSLYLRTFGFT